MACSAALFQARCLLSMGLDRLLSLRQRPPRQLLILPSEAGSEGLAQSSAWSGRQEQVCLLWRLSAPVLLFQLRWEPQRHFHHQFIVGSVASPKEKLPNLRTIAILDGHQRVESLPWLAQVVTRPYLSLKQAQKRHQLLAQDGHPVAIDHRSLLVQAVPGHLSSGSRAS